MAAGAKQVIDELAKIAVANVADYMDNDLRLDFSELIRDQAAALQEVTVEDFTDGVAAPPRARYAASTLTADEIDWMTL